MKRRNFRVAAVITAALLFAGCANDSSERADTSASPSSTGSTTTATTGEPAESAEAAPDPAEDGYLETLVESLGDTVEDCCEVGEDGVDFTFAAGGGGHLSHSGLDPHEPVDQRRGLDDVTSQSLSGGGGVLIGDPCTPDPTVRFDCDGFRYTLSMIDGTADDAVDAAATISRTAGCEKPSLKAPTECLGRPSDPEVRSDPEGHVPQR